jgi:hypothetical protein
MTVIVTVDCPAVTVALEGEDGAMVVPWPSGTWTRLS